MYIAYDKIVKEYVKRTGWEACYTKDPQEAKVYRSISAIKNSLGKRIKVYKNGGFREGIWRWKDGFGNIYRHECIINKERYKVFEVKLGQLIEVNL